jgi:hypothetical protein
MRSLPPPNQLLEIPLPWLHRRAAAVYGCAFRFLCGLDGRHVLMSVTRA